MSILSRLYAGIEKQVIQRATDSRVIIEAALRRGDTGRGLSKQVTANPKNIQAQTLKMYKNAVAAATSPDNPDWSALADLYDNLLLDNHLGSVIESRILFVQRSPFKLVGLDKKKDDEATELLQRPWMEELMKMVLMSRFQGRTLIELYETIPDGDNMGELAEVSEIPQSHFNAPAGLILKEPGSATGWSYKEGLFAPNYVQVGRDRDLGMLERLCFIVLAKKLGFGSWLDYIEKFGIPPIFITTDREDDARLEQLFQAASNFKSSNFLVGRGAEKFEVGNVTGAGVAPFDALIDRANNEISKRVLGGSGIADEKAFVGSAEIQFRLAKDRFESDKLLFKYVFNAHIKQRLVALSPVYAPLANLKLEWDDAENLSQKEVIDAIVKLGALYDIDIDWVSEVTGIPIVGIKAALAGANANANTKGPAEGGPAKK